MVLDTNFRQMKDKNENDETFKCLHLCVFLVCCFLKGCVLGGAPSGGPAVGMFRRHPCLPLQQTSPTRGTKKTTGKWGGGFLLVPQEEEGGACCGHAESCLLSAK